jgi:hypothetical protein
MDGIELREFNSDLDAIVEFSLRDSLHGRIAESVT